MFMFTPLSISLFPRLPNKMHINSSKNEQWSELSKYKPAAGWVKKVYGQLGHYLKVKEPF